MFADSRPAAEMLASEQGDPYDGITFVDAAIDAATAQSRLGFWGQMGDFMKMLKGD